MSKGPYILKFIDAQGAQAIYTHKEQWYHISQDKNYEPMKFENEQEAFNHHRQNGYYTASTKRYETLGLLTAAVRTEFQKHDIPDVPLEEIIHLAPESIQKEYWARQQEKRDSGQDPKQPKRR